MDALSSVRSPYSHLPEERVKSSHFTLGLIIKIITFPREKNGCISTILRAKKISGLRRSLRAKKMISTLIGVGPPPHSPNSFLKNKK